MISFTTIFFTKYQIQLCYDSYLSLLSFQLKKKSYKDKLISFRCHCKEFIFVLFLIDIFIPETFQSALVFDILINI